MFFKPQTAVNDYERSMLPQTRKQVFFDITKLHFWKLLLLGFVILLFSLPIHIYAISQNMYEAALQATYTDIFLNGSAEEIAKAQLELNNSVVSFSNTRALCDIVLFMFFALGMAGVSRVIRRLAFEENTYLRHDLIAGIKENGAQFVLIALFVGIAAFGCNYIQNQAMTTYIVTGKSLYTWLGLIPAILLAVIFIPPAMYAASCIAVYKNKFRQNVRIGFILYISSAWKTLLAVICCLLIYAIQYIPLPYCNIIGRTLSGILTPFVMLGWQLFALNRLDQKINPKFYPELIGKGLYKTEVEQPERADEQIDTDNQESTDVPDEGTENKIVKEKSPQTGDTENHG